MRFEQSVIIDKGPEDVFLVYKDVSSWAIWDPETEAASLDGEFAIGSTGKIKPKGAPESKIELIEVTRDKSFTVECGLPLCKMHFIHNLEKVDRGTKVTNQLVFYGLSAPIFGRFLGKSISSTIPSSLNGLKVHVESIG